MTANQQHTPEPWRDVMGKVFDGRGYAVPINEQTIAVCVTARQHEDAARIVACVNAMAGLNPDALPDLIAAAERLNAAREHANANDPEWDASWDALRAALARAKGEK